MSSLFRDTAFGFFIRLITKNKFLKYPEELPGFSFPYKIDTESTADTRNSIEKKEEDVLGDSEGSSRSLVNADEERAVTDVDLALQAVGSRAVEPVKVGKGVILVEWYGAGQYTQKGSV